jgi:hypothetical protein
MHMQAHRAQSVVTTAALIAVTAAATQLTPPLPHSPLHPYPARTQARRHLSFSLSLLLLFLYLHCFIPSFLTTVVFAAGFSA